MKHTHVKGPWIIQRDFRYNQDAFSIERKGDGLRSIVALMNDNWICNEHGDLTSTAMLISAAPDMFEVLKEVRFRLSFGDLNHIKDEPWIIRLNEVLSKAEGAE